ncbi:hypothetical protein F511_22991 [Dorcoceras hygrometricum]|uniref:CCHC-type domain-containing protein n=1 Tax=Dorcoceras hygrometricum TaxID=472368 RepID=A0A2Z7B622_9LAMI|nr:hypothetical protein F511_22991 [Dorcoceras hygrometricum]
MQFKKMSGSSSSGSGSSSSGGTKVEYCGQCGGKHPTAQCVGVQGSCNFCGQYGHFSRVCPLSGLQHTTVPPYGRGGSSRGRSVFPVQQQRLGEPQFRPFQQPGPSRFGQSQFSGPQLAQVNAMTREQIGAQPALDHQASSMAEYFRNLCVNGGGGLISHAWVEEDVDLRGTDVVDARSGRNRLWITKLLQWLSIFETCVLMEEGGRWEEDVESRFV